SASSAATFESGTVGTDGFGGVDIMRGPLHFFVSANVFLTPQGSVDESKVSHESRPRKSLKSAKCRFLGLLEPFWAGHPQTCRVRRARRVVFAPTFATLRRPIAPMFFVPAPAAASLDDVVGARDQGRRHVDSQR